MKFQIVIRNLMWISLLAALILLIGKIAWGFSYSWLLVPYPVFGYCLIVTILFVVEYKAISVLINQRVHNKEA